MHLRHIEDGEALHRREHRNQQAFKNLNLAEIRKAAGRGKRGESTSSELFPFREWGGLTEVLRLGVFGVGLFVPFSPSPKLRSLFWWSSP